jgi:hypothetical protein
MATWSVVDPGLPTLPLAFDLKHVVRLFAEQWPVSGVGPVTILDCRRQDVYYQPATRCVTTYALFIEQVGAAPWRTIGVIEVTPAGLLHRLYFDDPDIPQLRCAVCGDAMRERFITLFEDHSEDCFEHHGVKHYRHPIFVKDCAVTPIRYKPGLRCTLRYDLSTSAGPQPYFGKLLAQNSERLMRVISTLYQASQMIPEMPRIAQPIAYWPELGMVIQSAITGAELHQYAFDVQVDMAKRQRWMTMAGASLAALHNFTLHDFTGADGLRRTLWDDLSDLREYSAHLEIAEPELAARFDQAIDDLATSAQGRTEVAPVASHGALRTDQFMIEHDLLALIDLDSFCWANPARDIGNLLAYLRWKAMRQPHYATFIERAERAFLAGYATVRALPAKEWLVHYQAVVLLKIVGRRFRNLAVQEWPLAVRLLDVVPAMLNDSWEEGNV